MSTLSLPRAQQLLAANPLSLGALTPAPAAQLLSQMLVRVKVEWKIVKVEGAQETDLTLGQDYLMPAAARGQSAGSTGAGLQKELTYKLLGSARRSE